MDLNTQPDHISHYLTVGDSKNKKNNNKISELSPSVFVADGSYIHKKK
jgi:hypothetical protein